MTPLNFEWMLTGCYAVSTIAMAYFPNYSNASSATRAFRNGIQRNELLFGELAETGYTRQEILLSPHQIAIIIKHWGMPNTAKKLVEKCKELIEPKLNRDRRFD